MLQFCARDVTELRKAQLLGDEKGVNEFLPMVFKLAGHRSWAHWVHEMPPLKYMGIRSASEPKRRTRD